MNKFETAVIFDPEWEEGERGTFLERLETIIGTFSGEVLDREEWGNRKLAYNIQKNSSGYYLFLRYSGKTGVVEEMERVMGLNEKVMRFLTTRFEKDIRGKYQPPPSIDEILDRDITELQSLRIQWKRGIATSEAEERKKEEEKAESAPPEEKAESAPPEEPGEDADEAVRDDDSKDPE